MLQALLGPIGNIATTFLKNRAEKAKAKQKLEVAKIEAATKKVQSDANWEEKAMDASANSWKDELWTVVFVAILIANFIPLWGIQEYMAKGFENLEKCPEWVTYGMYASIAASFGLRSFTKLRRK